MSGGLISDIYIMIPNGFAIVLGSAQLLVVQVLRNKMRRRGGGSVTSVTVVKPAPDAIVSFNGDIVDGSACESGSAPASASASPGTSTTDVPAGSGGAATSAHLPARYRQGAGAATRPSGDADADADSGSEVSLSGTGSGDRVPGDAGTSSRVGGGVPGSTAVDVGPAAV